MKKLGKLFRKMLGYQYSFEGPPGHPESGWKCCKCNNLNRGSHTCSKCGHSKCSHCG